MADQPRRVLGKVLGQALATTIFLALAILVGAPPAHAQSVDDPVGPAERERVESIVRDYLMRNPEIILEAIEVLEQREQAASDAARENMLSALVPTLSASPLTPIVGAEDSDVIMVEFFDYQCGYCKRLFPGMKDIMASDPKLKVIFVEYPVIGPASLVAARAAIASQNQGLYMEFHEALMNHKGRLDDATILSIADSVGLDVDQLKVDMEAPEIVAYLRDVRGLAEGLGIRGTPSMVIGDNFIGGYVPPERLKGVIDMVRGEG